MKTKKAAPQLTETAVKTNAENRIYTKAELDSRRKAKIEQHLSDMPKACRGIYKKAVQGNSLRACINSQCLECTGWHRKEITLCTCLACPLYTVRPHQEILKNGHNEPFSGTESKNPAQGYIG
jgi:hypothetical protein